LLKAHKSADSGYKNRIRIGKATGPILSYLPGKVKQPSACSTATAR
jgi:hypothetical protein